MTARHAADRGRPVLAVTTTAITLTTILTLTTTTPPPARHAHKVTVWQNTPWFKQIVSSRERP